MICAGIDAGSRTIKIVLIDADTKQIVASGLKDQGVEQDKLTKELFDELKTKANINGENIGKIIATGYGRNIVSCADTTITEITCHAAGVRHMLPQAGTVIDIGGQDSKIIHLDSSGKVRDFAMNDRCAAGTGRFLEIVATRLDIPLDSLGRFADKSTAPAPISSMCVVFAETEIVGLLASGAPPRDIVRGVQKAIASRITALAGKKITPPIVFTGGVALVSGMSHALEAALEQKITVATQPQMTGALGAALLAAKNNSIKK
jgi:predicted CoA-substrate-specific enzyme activase